MSICASADVAVRDHAYKELIDIIKPFIPDPGESPPYDDHDITGPEAFTTKLVYIFPDNH